MHPYRKGQLVTIHKYKWSHANRLKTARRKCKLGLWKRVFPDEWDLSSVQVFKVLDTRSIKQFKLDKEPNGIN